MNFNLKLRLDRRADTEGDSAYAILVVLLLITVLISAAAALVLTVRVETKLAAQSDWEAELRWAGLSAVELAKYVLSESLRSPAGMHTSLNQLWAGGPGEPLETNGPLASLKLKDFQCGAARISIQLIDLERFANINRADPILLTKAFEQMGLDLRSSSVLIDSILDWIDPDDEVRPNGAESEYYMRMTPPYLAKNGPIDDLGELLMVRGVTPELVWGERPTTATLPYKTRFRAGPLTIMDGAGNKTSLCQLFTTISSGMININTAPPNVLQLLPGIDQNAALAIQQARAGPDGIEGTEDDTPFTSLAMLNPTLIPGLPPPEVLTQLRSYITVQSRTFEMQAHVRVGQESRTFYAILIRLSPIVVETISFWWE